MQEEENDIVQEDLDDSVVAEEYASESISKLRGKLKEAEAKAKEYLDGWQRSQADFANLRKRDEEAKMEFLKFAEQGLIVELIPVLDSFNIALSARSTSSGQAGLEQIYKQLLNVLKSKGLEESNPVGEVFDPRFHEAISTEAVDKAEEDHKILEVAQKGYILSGKIIRPAKVKIGQLKDK